VIHKGNFGKSANGSGHSDHFLSGICVAAHCAAEISSVIFSKIAGFPGDEKVDNSPAQGTESKASLR
jgi:hypothetical protein